MRIRTAPDVLFQELDGEAVLLNLGNEQYYGLDEMGVYLWQLLHTHGDVEQVVAELHTHYAVDRAILRKDVLALLTELQQAGLVLIDTAGLAA